MNTKTGAVATVKYQAGLSIIEIMVALLLSSLLTLGLVQVFTGNSQSFRLNEANSRVQESGRIALEMLSRAVRNAGYYGCRPMNGLVNNLDTTDDDYDESLHKFDWSEGSIYSGDTDRPPNALDGTDYLQISSMETETFDVVE